MKKRRRIIRTQHKRRSYIRKDGTKVKGTDVRETTYFRDIDIKKKGKKRRKRKLRQPQRIYRLGEIQKEPLWLKNRKVKRFETIKQHGFILNPDNTSVSLQGRTIVTIPQPNKYLLEAKLKSWIQDNQGYLPDIYKYDPHRDKWLQFGFSDLIYSELLDKAIKATTMEDRKNLQEIGRFAVELSIKDRIKPKRADVIYTKSGEKYERLRLQAAQEWAKRWQEWAQLRYVNAIGGS